MMTGAWPISKSCTLCAPGMHLYLTNQLAVRVDSALRQPGATEQLAMGDEIHLNGTLRLDVTLPLPAHVRLLKDGHEVASLRNGRQLTFETNEPGVFRVEAHRSYHLAWTERAIRRRPWIFSNPIYVRRAS